MAFDAESFRKAAKAAGHSDADIEKTINSESYALSSTDQLNKDIGNDWWHLPVAFGLGGAAVAGYKALKGEPTTQIERIEPTMEPMQTSPSGPTPVKPPQTNLTADDLSKRLDSLKTQAPLPQTTAIAPPTNTSPFVGPPAPGIAPPEMAGPPAPQYPQPAQVAENMVNDQPLAVAKSSKLQPMPKDLTFNGEPVTPGGRQVLTSFGYSQDPALAMERYKGLVESLGKQPTAGPKGGAIVEAPQYESFLDKQVGASRYPLAKDFFAAKKGNTAGTMKEFTGPPKQTGGISPAMALNVAGNALGALNIAKQLKNKDYANAGVDTFLQILSNLAPRMGLAASLLSPVMASAGTLDTPEAKELFNKNK